MMRIAVLVLLLIAGAASGQNLDAVVQVQCGASVGSGVLIGDRLVLTCAHVMRDEDPSRVLVSFRNGERHAGNAVSVDNYWDQGLIELSSTPSVQPVPIATSNPRPNDAVWSAGYDGGQEVVLRGGRVLKYLTPASDDMRADWFALSGAVRPGSSGGPVFDSQGRVIGCLWGASDDNTTAAVMLGRTQRFLLPWNARLAAVRAARQPLACAPGRACAPPAGRRVYATPMEPLPAMPAPATSAPATSAPATSAPVIDIDPAVPAVDYQKIVDMLKEDEDFLASVRGPKGDKGDVGDPGPAGPPGPAGAAGQNAELTAEHIATMTAAILQAIKSDQQFQTSIKGDPGPPGPAGPPGEAANVAAILQRLDAMEKSTFRVRVTNPASGLTQTGDVSPFGGYLHINLDPVPVQGR